MARLRKSLLFAGILVALGLAAALVWRELVVEAAARFALSAGGLGDARFEVAEVGWTGAVIENLALGPGLPAVRRVRLEYAPGELVRGRVGTAHVEGLRYEVPPDWRAARARLESLAAGGGEGRPAVSRLAFADAVVTFAGRDGQVTVDGALDLSGGGAGAALDVAVALAGTEAAFTLRSDALGAGGAVTIGGRGTARLAGLPLPGPAATGGRAAFSLQGTAPIPAEAGSPEAWLDPRLALAGDLRLSGVATPSGVLSADIGWTLNGSDGALRLALPRPAEVTVADLSPGVFDGLPAVPGGAPSSLSLELSGAGALASWSPSAGGGSADLEGRLVLRAGEASAEAQGSVRVVHDVSLRLAAPAEIAVRAEAAGLHVRAPDAGGQVAAATWDAAGSIGAGGAVALRGPLSARIDAPRLGSAAAASGTVDGTLGIEVTPAGWSLRLDPEAALAAEGVTMPGRLRIDDRVSLTLDRLALGGGESPARLDLSGVAGPVAGVLFEGGGQEIPFADGGGRITLDLRLADAVAGEVRFEAVGLTLPREAVRLDEAHGALRFGAEGVAQELRLSAEARDTGRVTRFAPLRVALAGTREGPPADRALPVSGTVETLSGALRLPLAGTVDLAASTARFSLEPARVTFREGGLQPGALGARLGVPGTVTGGVGISGEVAVDSGGAVRTRLHLALDQLALRGEAFEVTGLSGRVALSRLAPPASAGPQTLAAAGLVAGVPIDSPRARFTILPRARGVAVQIHEGTGALAGGEVAVSEARWDTAAETNAVDVRVRDVSIERLLSDWQIEGLSGTGRLSGEIPVRVGPAGLVIEGGRLEAGGAGRISVDWGSARETLVGSGEQVALTVRALEDFRYESLSIGVDRPADGALTLAIGLEGANPEVLDGYPFRFNITLSGRLEPILAAVREGRRIGADLLRGGLGASP